MINKYGAVFLFISLSFFSACTNRVTLDIPGSPSVPASLSFDTALGAEITSLLSKLTNKASGSVLDASEIKAALQSVPSVLRAETMQKGRSGASGSLNMNLTHQSLRAYGITVDIRQEHGTLSASMNRKEAREFLSGMSRDLVDYLSTLMAPVVTGEDLDESAYYGELAAVWGEGVAREIGAAEVTLTLNCPAQVRIESGIGRASGKKAVFTFPLTSILVMEKPLVIGVVW